MLEFVVRKTENVRQKAGISDKMICEGLVGVRPPPPPPPVATPLLPTIVRFISRKTAEEDFVNNAVS